MEQMISELGREDVYILIGLGFSFVAAVVIVLIYLRYARKRPEVPPLVEGQRSPYEANAPAAAARPMATEPRETAAVKAPGDDVPADVVARTRQATADAIAVEAPGAGAVADIQKPAPKPLGSALANTRSGFFGRIKSLFGSRSVMGSGELEELEEILYTSDLGPRTVQRLLEAVEARVKADGASGFEAVRGALKNEMLQIFDTLEANASPTPANGSNGHGNGSANGAGNGNGHVAHGSEDGLEGLEELAIWNHKPGVLLVVGVNGAGKTTTIGKLARRFAASGRKVLVAAGDTFRAAAGDQLKIWTERAQVQIFSPDGVTDPSAVAYAAVEQAKAGGFDLVIIDTAGRLHTQKNLMEELKKMRRVIAKLIPDAPHEVLLVLDANSGQNALVQAREFHQALQVSGVVLTKLDGSAKGGVALGLACELGLPIKLIGVGEGIDDLRRFSSREFVDSII